MSIELVTDQFVKVQFVRQLDVLTGDYAFQSRVVRGNFHVEWCPCETQYGDEDCECPLMPREEVMRRAFERAREGFAQMGFRFAACHICGNEDPSRRTCMHCHRSGFEIMVDSAMPGYANNPQLSITP